jgi:TPR repeat protein
MQVNQTISRDILLSWYEVRDFLVGDACLDQDIKKALELASVCSHPDAVWLSQLFLGKEFNTCDEAAQIFHLFGNEDPRAICFAAVVLRSWDMALLERAAHLNYAFAQSKLCHFCSDENALLWAQKAVLQGERDGYFYMGVHFTKIQNVQKANEYYALAADLGDTYAMVNIGLVLSRNDVKRWEWFGQAAQRHDLGVFLQELEIETERRFSTTISFAIGRVLNGNVDLVNVKVFGRSVSVAVIEFGSKCVSFFNHQLKMYRFAVDEWTHVALRNRVVKDIRRLVAKLIWDTRHEGLYEEINVTD